MSEELEGEEQLFEHYRYVADPAQEALRIDKYLLDRVPNTSRNKIQEAAKDGYVKVNDEAVKSNYKVKPGDVVTVEFPNPVREVELLPENIPLDVLFEDDHVIVINKPAGLVVHPGFGNWTGTLVNGLIYHFNNLPENTQHGIPRPGLVHRLDKNTSGVMVIGKTDHSLTHLSEQFANRTSDRRYEALVWGRLDEDGTVDGHVGRSLQNRKVMTVFPDGEYGKHAITHYKHLESFNYLTLVECKLETGRTHQIRAHMKHIGHPLFGDVEYGGDKVLKGTHFSKYKQFVENGFRLVPHQALHAKSLAFDHPVTGERLTFEVPLPENMLELLDRWRKYINTYS